MSKRNIVSSTTDDEKSKVYLNPDESAIKLLADKLAYHEKQINFHRKEANEINRILDLMEKYGVTKHAPDTIGGFSITRVYGGGDSPDVREFRHRDFWKKKSIEYINACGILVQAANIFASIGATVSTQERRSIMSTLSLALADLCEDGKLKKFAVEGVKGFYYGTPEMFNNDTPIVEY